MVRKIEMVRRRDRHCGRVGEREVKGERGGWRDGEKETLK